MFFTNIIAVLTSFSFAQEVCIPYEPNPKQIAAKIYKEAAIQESRDPHFCKRNAMLEYMQSQKESVSEKTSTEDLEKILNKKQAQKIQDIIESEEDPDQATIQRYHRLKDPWETSLMSTWEQRAAGIKRLFVILDYPAGPPDEYPKSKKMTAETRDKILENIKRLERNQPKDLNFNTPKLIALCAKMNIANSLSCARAVEKILPEVIPTGSDHGDGTKFSNLQDWKEIMTNDRFDEGINNMASTVLDRVFKISKKEDLNGVDIQKDFISSFKKAGMSTEDASKASLKVLALMANGSSNTIYRCTQLEMKNINDFNEPDPAVSQKCRDLSLIAVSILGLDAKKSSGLGLPLYTLPENVSSYCDNGKSYHFWMIARIADKLKNEYGFSKETAAQAAFIIEKGYHLKRSLGRPTQKTTDFGMTDEAFTEDAFSPVLSNQRADLSFAAAGAVYGANQDKKETIKMDMDEGMRELIRKSNVTAPISTEEVKSMGDASKYLRWENRFSPNAVFEYLNKGIPQ